MPRGHWVSTAKTVLLATVSALPLLPQVATALGIHTVPLVVAVLTVSAAIDRACRVPAVAAWLDSLRAEDEYMGKHRLGD